MRNDRMLGMVEEDIAGAKGNYFGQMSLGKLHRHGYLSILRTFSTRKRNNTANADHIHIERIWPVAVAALDPQLK